MNVSSLGGLKKDKNAVNVDFRLISKQISVVSRYQMSHQLPSRKPRHFRVFVQITGSKNQPKSRLL